MKDVPGMAVAEAAQQLEREPFLLNVLQKGPGAHAIVQRAVEILPDQEPARLGLDNALVRQGIRHIGESLSLR